MTRFHNYAKAEFWIDGDENSCNTNELISTQSLVFKDGHVIDSFCSGIGNFSIKSYFRYPYHIDYTMWFSLIKSIWYFLDYCFRAQSSESASCVENITDWSGSDIEVLQNGISIGEFTSGFTDSEVCIAMSLVDIKRDTFELKLTGNNGVCITGLGSENFELTPGWLFEYSWTVWWNQKRFFCWRCSNERREKRYPWKLLDRWKWHEQMWEWSHGNEIYKNKNILNIYINFNFYKKLLVWSSKKVEHGCDSKSNSCWLSIPLNPKGHKRWCDKDHA